MIFSWGKNVLNYSIEFLTASLVPGIIRYSIDSNITFRFTNFFKNVVSDLSLVINLKSIRNIMWWCIFRLLISSQFSHNWMKLSIHISKWFTIARIYLNPYHTQFERRTVSVWNLLLGYKIHYVLLLHLSCFRKK